MASAAKKIEALDRRHLAVLAKDNQPIAPRISISGVSESTLRSLVEHELEDRQRQREDKLAQEEIRIKKRGNTIKIIGIVFTLVNGLILALYKDWIG